MYYTYNYKNQKWISSDAEIYQPLFTPFSVKQKKAWCSVHKKWEACGKALNGKLFYECGCPIPSQFASVNTPATEIFLLKSGTLSENGHWKEILALLQLILGYNHEISFWNSTNTFWDLWFWLH